MLPAQVNNQGYKQPQAFEESAAPTRYDKQRHWKDIPNVRAAPQGESKRAEDRTCSSHTPTYVPCHPEITKLCSHSWSNCSSHAILCRLSLAFGTLTDSKPPKSIRAGAKRGHYRAMRDTDLLSWCYMNTMTTCCRRKPSTQTSTGSIQSRQNCQQHSQPVEQVTYSSTGHSWSSHSWACLQTFLLEIFHTELSQCAHLRCFEHGALSLLSKLPLYTLWLCLIQY